MTDPTTSWINFDDRSPTEEELNSDMRDGYKGSYDRCDDDFLMRARM